MKRLWTGIVVSMLFVALMGSVPVGASEYLLGVGDALNFVWGHSDLTTEVAVRPDGYITFPSRRSLGCDKRHAN